MNIFTCIKSMVAVALLMSASSAVFAGSGTFPSRIAKQTNAVEVARVAKEINSAESASLKKEIQAISALYKLYWKDKVISKKEAKALNAKINNSDVNLFRKKYD